MLSPGPRCPGSTVSLMRLFISTLSFFLFLSCSRPQDFVSVDYTVMGTSARVVVPRDKRALADSAYVQMLLVDSLMSIWKPESELSTLNALGAMRVNPLILRCVKIAKEAARATGGAFDPTVWPLVHAWGFDSDSPRVPAPESLEAARTLVNWQGVGVIGDSVFLGPGQRLDLGGVAKGFALDLAGEKLRELGCKDFLVEIGGDMICRGSKRGAPWVIGVRDPRNRGGVIGLMRVCDATLCTSGDYERFVETGGERYSHIMDPREGEPARGVVSVTVMGHGDAAFLDALATGLFVVGPGEGVPLAESLGVEAMFVYQDGDTLGISRTKGFPEITR